ncbi:MAG: hypothetical protein ABI240_01170 [Sphingomonas sp.]
MLSYDEAIDRALAAFRSAHPIEALPAWFENGAFRDDTVTRDGKIQIRYYAQPASPLNSNQSWIETDRGPVVQELDPISGEKKVVISRDVPKQITLFCVSVDPVSGNTTIIEDSDISALSDNDIESPKASTR